MLPCSLGQVPPKWMANRLDAKLHPLRPPLLPHPHPQRTSRWHTGLILPNLILNVARLQGRGGNRRLQLGTVWRRDGFKETSRRTSILWRCLETLECIQSCINLPHSQQHRLKDHSHPRLRTSRTASAPPLSNIFGQSLGFAKRRLLYNRQCKVAKQPWPSPCRNGPPAAKLQPNSVNPKICRISRDPAILAK